MVDNNFQFPVSSFQFLKKWKWAIIACLGIVVLFFILRLANLTILPIFADEAIYIRWSQVMRAEPTLRFLPLSDGKQPLFMWLTIPFLKIFTDPLISGRFLSILCGLGSVLGLGFLTWLLFKEKRTALMVAFLYAILPFFVFFDRLALVDSMLLMFGTWLAFLSLWLIRSPRLDLTLISGLVLGGALITKSPAVFFAILFPLALITGEKLKKKILPFLGFWFLILVFGFGIYNFLLRLGPGFQMIAIRNRDYLFTFKEILSHPLDPLKPHLGDLRQWLPNLLTWPVLLASLGGIIVGLRKKWKAALFLLIWMIVPLLTQAVFAKVFTPRYILFTIWPLVIFAAFFLEWLLVWLRKKYWVVIFLLIILVPGLRYNWWLLTNPEKAPLPRNLRNGHLEEWTAGQGIKESAGFLKERAKNNKVFVGTEGFFGTLPDGLQVYLEGTPNIRVIGVGWPVSEVSGSLINSLVDNEVYLLVNQSRLNLVPQNNGLILVKEYVKAAWPDGSPRGEAGHRDKLLLFQLDKNYWEGQVRR